MYCKFCGATLNDDAKFCLSCGAVASASDEKVEPKAAKSEFTHDKRDPREVFSSKGENYYNYDNSFLQHKSYQSDIYIRQSRNKHLTDPIQYTENIGGQIPENIKNSINKEKKKNKKTVLKVCFIILAVAVAAGGICIALNLL